MSLTDATNRGDSSAPRPPLAMNHAGAGTRTAPTGRTPTGLAAVIACLAATVVLLTGDSGANLVLAAFEQSPNQPPCIAGDDPLPSAPMAGAVTSTFDTRPIRLAGYMTSGDSTLAQHEAILDFPVPPSARPGTDAIVLLTYTVHNATIADGWSPSRSIALFAFQQIRDTTMTTALCPVDTPAIRAAIRAGGHTPMPETVRAGKTATGSIAIPVPPNVLALTLRQQWRYSDGFSATTGPFYEKEGAHSWPQNAG